MRRIRSTDRRLALRAVFLLCVAAATLGACASAGPERPELPDRVSPDRPDGLVPEGVTEMRETLASQRADTRASMDAALIHPSTLSETSTGGGIGAFLGDLAGAAVDVASLTFLGIW